MDDGTHGIGADGQAVGTVESAPAFVSSSPSSSETSDDGPISKDGDDDRQAETYIGTKLLRASPMSRGDYNAYRGWTPPAGEDQSVAGYLVEYLDGGGANDPRHEGYISWSPADVFERAYRPIVGRSFGDALEALKVGNRVARAGWNGKGMFAYLVPAASYPVQTGAAIEHFGEGAMVPYRAYLALKTVDGDVATWSPSCSDVLAEDWEIIG